MPAYVSLLVVQSAKETCVQPACVCLCIGIWHIILQLWSRAVSKSCSILCRDLGVQEVVSANTTEGKGRSDRKGQDRCAGSRVDSIVHFTSAQQVPRGGLLLSGPPDWLSGASNAARVWLQHWLKPKHLKGEAL